MQKQKRRPKAAVLHSCRPNYFGMEDMFIAAEADIAEAEAASMAEVAAAEADIMAEVAASEALLDIGVVVTMAGVVTVVVVDTGGVSSFLVQAAKLTAAASETINRVVFIFLLDLGSDNFRELWEPFCQGPSSIDAGHFSMPSS